MPRRLRYTATARSPSTSWTRPTSLHKAVCRANLELAAAVGATGAGASSGRRPGAAGAGARPAARRRARGLAEMGDSPARLGCGSRWRRCSSRARPSIRPTRSGSRPSCGGGPSAVVGTLDVSHSYLMTSFRAPRSPTVAAFARSLGISTCTILLRPPAGHLGRASTPIRSRWRSASATCTCPSAGATSRSRPCCPAARAARHRAHRRAGKRPWCELERCAAFAWTHGADERRRLSQPTFAVG